MYRITLPHILNKINVKIYKNLNKINTKVFKVQSLVFFNTQLMHKYVSQYFLFI